MKNLRTNTELCAVRKHKVLTLVLLFVKSQRRCLRIWVREYESHLRFTCDNAFDMRACMLFLESFSASCFTYTLQLVSKDSLFLESNIGVLIAKALQTILTL